MKVDNTRLDKTQVFWWSPIPFLGLKIFQKENVGDLLGPLLVQKILDSKGLRIHDINKRKLLTIGSVMHFADTGDTLWGTGVNGKVADTEHHYADLDVRAVRGPLTAEYLKRKSINVPEIYGDPGVLVADLWPRSQATEPGKVLYIPHMREKKFHRKGLQTLSPLVSLEKFIAEIQTAEKVISSSLHGVIIAESYGVPACLFQSANETAFKYEDYYQGTGRHTFKVFDDIAAARKYEPEVPDFTLVKKNLLSDFPWDLWQK